MKETIGYIWEIAFYYCTTQLKYMKIKGKGTIDAKDKRSLK